MTILCTTISTFNLLCLRKNYMIRILPLLRSYLFINTLVLLINYILIHFDVYSLLFCIFIMQKVKSYYFSALLCDQ